MQGAGGLALELAVPGLAGPPSLPYHTRCNVALAARSTEANWLIVVSGGAGRHAW